MTTVQTADLDGRRYVGGDQPGFRHINSSGRNELLKSNLAAIVDPTSLDDSGAGYSVGSEWINLSTDKVWICTDASSLAAVWKDVSQTTSVGGSNGQLLYNSGGSIAGVSSSAVSGANITLGGNIKPNTNDSYDLGGAVTNRWRVVHSRYFAQDSNVGTGFDGGTNADAYNANFVNYYISGLRSASLGGSTNSARFSGGPVIVENTLIARQASGIAGTDEVQISHDGTNGLVKSMDGQLKLHSVSGGQVNIASHIRFDQGDLLWFGGHSAESFRFISGGGLGIRSSQVGGKIGCSSIINS